MWLVNAIVYSTLFLVAALFGTAVIHLVGYLDTPTQRASIVLMSPQDTPKGEVEVDHAS